VHATSTVRAWSEQSAKQTKNLKAKGSKQTLTADGSLMNRDRVHQLKHLLNVERKSETIFWSVNTMESMAQAKTRNLSVCDVVV
jgi:hypothetical protein